MSPLLCETIALMRGAETPPREAQEAVTVEPTGRVARKFAPGEISVGLHDGREWDFGLQPSAKRYKEKFG